MHTGECLPVCAQRPYKVLKHPYFDPCPLCEGPNSCHNQFLVWAISKSLVIIPVSVAGGGIVCVTTLSTSWRGTILARVYSGGVGALPSIINLVSLHSLLNWRLCSQTSKYRPPTCGGPGICSSPMSSVWRFSRAYSSGVKAVVSRLSWSQANTVIGPGFGPINELKDSSRPLTAA